MSVDDINELDTFPVDLPYTIRRTPRQNKLMSPVESGRTQRRQQWPGPIYEYEISFPVLKNDDRDTLETFWVAHNYSLSGIDYFLFEDPKDHHVSGTLIGTGDGSTQKFRIKRQYKTTNRRAKPQIQQWLQSGTTSFFWNESGIDDALYTVDHVNGAVTFNSAPASGVDVTASYDFYRRCIFDEQQWPQDARNEKYQQTTMTIREVP